MNIVTIDFDIIMAPVIGSYNDLVSTDYYVDEMIERFPYMASALPDFYIYDYLCQYIYEVFKCIPDINQIYFVESHEEIIPYINNDGEDIIYNIDHHHDIGYTTKDLTLKLVEADCSNWVKFLKERHKIKEYHWIKDKYAEDIQDNERIVQHIDKIYELQNYNLLKLAKQTDKLIICKSAPWVPAAYDGLYSSWETTLDAFKEMRKKIPVDINN